MAVGTVKLATYNTLAESAKWKIEAIIGNFFKPPIISLVTAGTNYTNIIGASALTPLLRDGDQNLPLFFSASPADIRVDFGLAIPPYAPKMIAFVNHNCFESGDKIEIRHGLNGPILVDTIEAPDRSVDLFYPLRFNDVWYNSGGVSDQFWYLRLIKASGNPYVGEIFFAADYFSYEEWDPQPRPPITFDYQKNAAIAELHSGSLVDYEIEPPFVNVGLDWGRKAEGATDKFLEHQVNTVCAAASHSPYKQVLVLYDDRVCVFGRLEPNGSYQELSDGSFSPSHRFRAEYPCKFYRSGLVA